MQFFNSYKEAHEQLKLPGSWQRGTIGTIQTGLSSIKLTANPNSLDQISSDLKRVYYVGKGKKGSPGEPIRPQDAIDQQAFYSSLRMKSPVAVLVKLKADTVVYLGHYTVSSVRLVPMRAASYYQITLVHCG